MTDNPDDYITGHAYQGPGNCDYVHPARTPSGVPVRCGQPSSRHAAPGSTLHHLIRTNPHHFRSLGGSGYCTFTVEGGPVCGYPESEHPLRPGQSGGLGWDLAGADAGDTFGLAEHKTESDVPEGIATHNFSPSAKDPAVCGFALENVVSGVGRRLVCGVPQHLHSGRADRSAVVRMADVAQYAREPMPDAARAGITVTLIDAPTDPLGTLAAISGMYEGKVLRSKSEVTDNARREAYGNMMATVLDGPLEAVQFTFLVEGADRAFTHQAVRNRFSFFAQESLRFAVADDWAAEVPLPPALAGRRDDDPLVMVWRRALNQAEDSYNALVGGGMAAEEARGLLPHAITTRYYWVVSLRTLLQEAGKRTCTQAQFHWRQMFAGVAKAFRERATEGEAPYPGAPFEPFLDNWQYELFANAIRPVCYQQGKCGFMAKFDRGCTIRERVDANERAGRPSVVWDQRGYDPATADRIEAIHPREWAADPAAARVVEEQ